MEPGYLMWYSDWNAGWTEELNFDSQQAEETLSVL
jgi:hypothetical protein